MKNIYLLQPLQCILFSPKIIYGLDVLIKYDTLFESSEMKQFFFGDDSQQYTYIPCIRRINNFDVCTMRLIFRTDGKNNILDSTKLYDMDKHKSIPITDITYFNKYLLARTPIVLFFMIKIKVDLGQNIYTMILEIINVTCWQKPKSRFDCEDYEFSL